MDSIAEPRAYRFDGFALDLDAGVLLRTPSEREAVPLPIGSRAFDILCLLIKRSGAVLSKREIMDAVWPNVAVEDNNLTVQISVLRRVLDAGRANGSCIQTLPGRGYRFLPAVTTRREGAPTNTDAPVRAMRPSLVPRLSVVVLPFRHLSHDPDGDHLAASITGGLITDLSRHPGTVVIAHEFSRHDGDRAAVPRGAGADLAARYAVEGDLRILDHIVRINVQLISTDSGVHVWSDRFDHALAERASSEDAITHRIALGIGNALVHAESARTMRERPDSPDAFDLVLRARSLMAQPASLDRFAKARPLYDEALRLDPGLVPALTGLAHVLTAGCLDRGYWLSGDEPERVAQLIEDAQTIAPADETVLARTAVWLEMHGQHMEAMAISRRIIETWPNNTYGYTFLARSKIYCGQAADAIPLLEKAIEVDPYNFSIFDRYWRLGFAHLLLKRERDALPWFHRAAAAYPDAPPSIRGSNYARFAAAYALIGEMDEARRALTESVRIWPFRTLRRLGHENYKSPVYAAQYRHFQHGLRLAGLRDHADEYADFEVASTDGLNGPLMGFTPLTVPGAQTIGTPELAAFARDHEPVIIDTMGHFWGRSVPGAIGLAGSGIGGVFTDKAQDRLARIMPELTKSDRGTPIVAVGFNSEAFDGRNLARRLVALGHTNVFWYRGGREAWEVAGLPERELEPWAW